VIPGRQIGSEPIKRMRLLTHLDGNSSVSMFWRLWLRCGITKMYLVRTMLMVMFIAVFSSCTPLSDCADTVISESVSPDGQLLAVVFERDCGATTGKNTQICFRRRTESFDSKRQSSFLIFEGDGKVVLSWKTQSDLVIRLPQDAKVFRKEAKASGVRIGYEVKGLSP
jgi:hypothetical protein